MVTPKWAKGILAGKYRAIFENLDVKQNFFFLMNSSKRFGLNQALLNSFMKEISFIKKLVQRFALRIIGLVYDKDLRHESVSVYLRSAEFSVLNHTIYLSLKVH